MTTPRTVATARGKKMLKLLKAQTNYARAIFLVISQFRECVRMGGASPFAPADFDCSIIRISTFSLGWPLSFF